MVEKDGKKKDTIQEVKGKKELWDDCETER